MGKAHEQGESELRVVCLAGGGDAGVYPRGDTAPENNAAHVLGVTGGEAVSLFKYVCRMGYVGLSPNSDLTHSYSFVTVDHIDRAGLLEIGALPDPRQHLISGLEAALRDIQQDPTLEPEEKEEKLNLGREALAFVRGVVTEVPAKIIIGG